MPERDSAQIPREQEADGIEGRTRPTRPSFLGGSGAVTEVEGQGVQPQTDATPRVYRTRPEQHVLLSTRMAALLLFRNENVMSRLVKLALRPCT